MSGNSVEELGSLVAAHRRDRGLSLRRAAEETSVAFNTLARIEKGYVPDLATFRRIAQWIGLPAADFFRDDQGSPSSTVDVIAAQLRKDPALGEEASEKIADILTELYAALAQPAEPTAAHLRAAKTFTPDAARGLASLLSDMREALRDE